MKIDDAITILQKYRMEYGNIPLAFISNNGEQNIANNIDVISVFAGDSEDVTENIVVIRDSFNYNNFSGAEYVPTDEDWENGYPGYEEPINNTNYQ